MQLIVVFGALVSIVVISAQEIPQIPEIPELSAETVAAITGIPDIPGYGSAITLVQDNLAKIKTAAADINTQITTAWPDIQAAGIDGANVVAEIQKLPDALQGLNPEDPTFIPTIADKGFPSLKAIQTLLGKLTKYEQVKELKAKLDAVLPQVNLIRCVVNQPGCLAEIASASLGGINLGGWGR